MERNWLVLYTKPRAEKKVEQRLVARGFDVFCPTYKTFKYWSDRKKKVEVPLLPSYVFVQVDEIERLEVLKDPGAMNFIFWQGKPAIVREQEIEALRTTLPINVIPEAEIGDFVTIDRGVFKGQTGRVKYLSNEYVVIVLESLGLTVQIKQN